jgi:hypothetical protein
MPIAAKRKGRAAVEAKRPVEQSQVDLGWEAIDIHDARWKSLHRRFLQEKERTGSSIRAIVILNQGIETEGLAIGVLPYDPVALGYNQMGKTSLQTPPSPGSAFQIPAALARDWFCIQLSSRGNHDDGTFEDSAALKWKSGAKRLPWPSEFLVADAADLMPESAPRPEPVEAAPTEVVKPEPADDTPTPPELLEELAVELTPKPAETEPEIPTDIPISKPVETTPKKRVRLRPGPKPRAPEPLWSILETNPQLLTWLPEKLRSELQTRYRAETGHILGDDQIDEWVREFRRRTSES